MLEFIRSLFCGHNMSPNLFSEKTNKGKRHFYVCSKCGKKEYVDQGVFAIDCMTCRRLGDKTCGKIVAVRHDHAIRYEKQPGKGCNPRKGVDDISCKVNKKKNKGGTKKQKGGDPFYLPSMG